MSEKVINMKCKDVKSGEIVHPTGNPNFSVIQPFPAAFTAEQVDPFLMCDEFGPLLSSGAITDPDEFPVGWHPHRGMDLLSYLTQGVGRHADSMGNREEFKSPGCQWISAGSGIEHAEGGGTPVGQYTHGFQIWVNVPSTHKLQDPRYGTVPPDKLPLFHVMDGISVRVLAGPFNTITGPFETVQKVQMLDWMLEPGKSFTHSIPTNMDNAIVYVYKGSGQVNGRAIKAQQAALLDASNPTVRGLQLSAGADGMTAMMFVGKRLNEPIVWHGPFVMNTKKEINDVINECRSGSFPPKRASWDYRQASAAPADPTESKDETKCGI